ncbi:YaaL family protein [Listeria costaricensis]|uniref:YaaL family protein n=1 Tax=Listeria costaricensis TaxID=2026604 RepID=UPI000C087F45|nr:YaaL family protein [Listeria costaricensis]
MEARSARHGRKKKKKIGKLHKEYDRYLLDLIEATQENWHKQKVLLHKSFGYDPRLEFEEKKAEAKYFYLFKEARHREVQNRPHNQ